MPTLLTELSPTSIKLGEYELQRVDAQEAFDELNSYLRETYSWHRIRLRPSETAGAPSEFAVCNISQSDASKLQLEIARIFAKNSGPNLPRNFQSLITACESLSNIPEYRSSSKAQADAVCEYVEVEESFRCAFSSWSWRASVTAQYQVSVSVEDQQLTFRIQGTITDFDDDSPDGSYIDDYLGNTAEDSEVYVFDPANKTYAEFVKDLDDTAEIAEKLFGIGFEYEDAKTLRQVLDDLKVCEVVEKFTDRLQKLNTNLGEARPLKSSKQASKR